MILWAAPGMQMVFAGSYTETDTVFLLDTSQSMVDSDAIRAAPDSILAMMATMGPLDRVGVIAYNTEAEVMQPLALFEELKPQKMLDVPYQGYTNPGAALNLAVDWLNQSAGDKKRIIIITDGEIMLPEENETLLGIKQFYFGVERASHAKLPIYTYSITTSQSQEYHINSGYTENEGGTSQNLLFNLWNLDFVKDMKPALINLPLEHNNGLNTVKLPLPGADKVRLVLRSSGLGNAWIGEQRVAPMFQGQHVKVFNLDNVTDDLSIRLDYPEDSAIQLEAVVQVGGHLRVTAEEKMWQYGVSVYITPLTDDKEEKLLADPWFNGKTVPVTVNHEERTGLVENGVIEVKLPDDPQQDVAVNQIAFADLGFIFTGDDSARVSVQRLHIRTVLVALIGMVIILGLLIRLKHRRQQGKLKAKQDLIPPDEGIPFKGRLCIYVTHTADDMDIPPAEYVLSRRYNGRGVALAEILQSCNISLELPETDKIVFGPLQRGVYILNYSNCNVVKGHDVLAKGGRAELFYDESIYIGFSDGVSELLLIYKRV